jgi:cellulose synthase (UDP-forming)
MAMRTNPVAPYSKLLILSGDNPDDLLTAAMALALQRDLFQSDQIRIPSLKVPAPRKPDAAPRWLSTDRITRIGDIALPGELQSDGSGPLNLYMRVPPDLFFGAQANLSFHMGYRYNSIPISDESSLQVYLNHAYISSIPLPHKQQASAQLDTIVPVPIVNMRPFSNSFMMKFIFLMAKKGRCQDTAPYNMQGSVLKDSFLDLRDIPHWATLPQPRDLRQRRLPLHPQSRSR